MNTDKCAKCNQPSVFVHLVSIDNVRRTFLLCCLCVAEMLAPIMASEDAR